MFAVLFFCSVAVPLGLVMFAAGLFSDMLASHPRGNTVATVGLVVYLGATTVSFLMYQDVAKQVVSASDHKLSASTRLFIENR